MASWLDGLKITVTTLKAENDLYFCVFWRPLFLRAPLNLQIQSCVFVPFNLSASAGKFWEYGPLKCNFLLWNYVYKKNNHIIFSKFFLHSFHWVVNTFLAVMSDWLKKKLLPLAGLAVWWLTGFSLLQSMQFHIEKVAFEDPFLKNFPAGACNISACLAGWLTS